MNRLPRMNFKTLLATAVCLTLINSVDLEVSRDRISASIDMRHDAYARSSGGRSGGGSFSRGSS
ncbi:MAG: hypothetical protein ACOCXU_07370, partial [Coleofasciculus sp.]